VLRVSAHVYQHWVFWVFIARKDTYVYGPEKRLVFWDLAIILGMGRWFLDHLVWFNCNFLLFSSNALNISF